LIDAFRGANPDTHQGLTGRTVIAETRATLATDTINDVNTLIRSDPGDAEGTSGRRATHATEFIHFATGPPEQTDKYAIAQAGIATGVA
jgi:hypothetical protein